MHTHFNTEISDRVLIDGMACAILMIPQGIVNGQVTCDNCDGDRVEDWDFSMKEAARC